MTKLHKSFGASRQSSSARAALWALLGALVLPACSNANPAKANDRSIFVGNLQKADGDAVSSLTTTPGSGSGSGSATVTAMADADAFKYLTTQCGGCHGTGQSLNLTWPLPDAANLTVASLQATPQIVDVYQALLNQYSNAPVGQQPTAMPPNISTTTPAQLEAFILWFQLNLPGTVKDAAAIYGAPAAFTSSIAIDLNYSCSQVSTARAFMNRFYNSAFGRPPTATELSTLVPAAELDQPITTARQVQIASMMASGSGKDEFYKYGLQLFAQQVSGAGSIVSNPSFGVSAAAATDLGLEFYQLLLKYADTKSYKEILEMPVVEVSSNTAPFYQDGPSPCPTPSAGTWAECQLSPKRSNFFGSVAFLNSAPSSLIASNNNYKRAGNIYGVLGGVILLAQTNGPKGTPPDPMPACLTTADKRMVLDDPTNAKAGAAPRGAVAVPRSGAICQGCHLYKYLDVASYVYRPFDSNGLEFTADAFNVGDKNNPYSALVTMASAPGIVNVSDPTNLPAATQVTPTFIQSLWSETTTLGAQCIADRSGNSVASIGTVGDLINFMVGDGSILIGGLSRYLPSVFAGMSTTNEEITSAVGQAYQTGNGELLPIFQAFFATQTFACAANGQ